MILIVKFFFSFAFSGPVASNKNMMVQMITVHSRSRAANYKLINNRISDTEYKFKHIFLHIIKTKQSNSKMKHLGIATSVCSNKSVKPLNEFHLIEEVSQKKKTHENNH